MNYFCIILITFDCTHANLQDDNMLKLYIDKEWVLQRN